MLSRFERTVAFRYLRARRKEGFISVVAGFSFLGITLGVATLIVVMAVMNGFRAELVKRILGINAHVSVAGITAPIDQYLTLAETLRQVEGVETAVPVVKGEVLATANDAHTGALVHGIAPEDLQKKRLIADAIKMGSLEEFSKPNSVVIGIRMSHSMGLLPGDTIRLISPETTHTFFGAMPRLKDYTVAAVFDIGMIEYDSSMIFMPIVSAQRYFGTENAATAIEVNVLNPEQVETVVEAINQKTGGQYRIIDWKLSNAHFFHSLKVERNVMFLILTLIILVAAFNIIAGMVMLVTDKGREIAILRTIGATRGSVMRIFLLCGASIGIIGTLSGFLLGMGFALNIEEIRQWLEQMTGTELFSAEIYFLSQLPAEVRSSDVLNVVLMALALSFVATLYPAWRAARVEPAEALRYE